MADLWSRFRQSRWFRLTWIVPVALAALAVIVVFANVFRSSPAGASFLIDYPGESGLPAGSPVGFPAWLQWQHFLNAFFLLFIVRTGWQVRTTKRPRAYWTRNNSGLVKTKNPPVRISLPLWLHLSMDSLWVVNGIVFFALIFATGQWVRIVPTNWNIFPNAISAGIQYASLNWPTEDGWVNYNALQTLSYFFIVFIAAPLALLTGIRMAPGLAARFHSIEKAYPITAARAVHFPVMIAFVVFVIVHVTLVLATGALRNLNHMYAGRDDQSWWGFGIFAASIVVMALAWVAARPSILTSVAGRTGSVRR
ncbi:cytochrome b/b6 domain-containing protein [Subtercola endophyticus]|uniref:cytochrome b/b6 domain-containing protein n=1 Tax=Subtercola endophyticus TaxID=2895559 RepID=UPI001E373C51|nr:cytochrome b/b6 domain-containing protein [Subtercola endophyticus]UFS58747.1 cytochrome b/b6 domain-containing protein [Subtercola endophyticus]